MVKFVNLYGLVGCLSKIYMHDGLNQGLLTACASNVDYFYGGP